MSQLSNSTHSPPKARQNTKTSGTATQQLPRGKDDEREILFSDSSSDSELELIGAQEAAARQRKGDGQVAKDEKKEKSTLHDKDALDRLWNHEDDVDGGDYMLSNCDSDEEREDQNCLETSRPTHKYATNRKTNPVSEQADVLPKKKRKSSFGARGEAKRRAKGLPAHVEENKMDAFALDGIDTDDDEISRPTERKRSKKKKLRSSSEEERRDKRSKKRRSRPSALSSVFNPTSLESEKDHVYGSIDSEGSSEEENCENGKRRPFFSSSIRTNLNEDLSIRSSESSEGALRPKASSSKSKNHPLRRLAAGSRKSRFSVESNSKRAGGLMQLELKPVDRDDNYF